jgi:hypothetical protein
LVAIDLDALDRAALNESVKVVRGFRPTAIVLSIPPNLAAIPAADFG